MKRTLKILFWNATRIFFSLFFRLNKNQIYFSSYNGLKYACNPRSISEKIHELDPNKKIIWSFKNPESINVPSYITKVKKNSFADIKALWTSKFWVMNAGFLVPQKRKNQFFMDTWHGDRAFKNVDKSADGKTSLADSYKCVDVLLSGSDYNDNVAKRAMKFNGEILHSGSPRNDIFFADFTLKKEQIRQELGISTFDKILTYAPTFREKDKGMEVLDFSSLIDALEARDQKKWGVLIRQHHKVKMQTQWNNDKRIIDASSYPEMQDILLISDVVISDYSSLVGDFILLRRPIFLYVPDLEEYKEGRGLYFDIQKSPFIFATNTSDLFQKILDSNEAVAKQNCEDILNFYGNVCENGTASEQAANWILNK
jgi:CDP-glycerol glycerophosphotransferase